MPPSLLSCDLVSNPPLAPAIALHRIRLHSGVTFNPISFGFTRRQEQPFFDFNQARAIPLCLAWNHFRLIISDNLQMFVNFFEEEEEVAQL